MSLYSLLNGAFSCGINRNLRGEAGFYNDFQHDDSLFRDDGLI